MLIKCPRARRWHAACACQCLQQAKVDLASHGVALQESGCSWKVWQRISILGKSAEKMMSIFLCFQNVIEKEELKLHLQASKDAQRQLTAEVLKTSIIYI